MQLVTLSRRQVREVLDEHGLAPRRALGQIHFFISSLDMASFDIASLDVASFFIASFD